MCQKRPPRISITRAILFIGGSDWERSSTNLDTKLGEDCQHKNPKSSRLRTASVFPAPDIPVTITSSRSFGNSHIYTPIQKTYSPANLHVPFAKPVSFWFLCLIPDFIFRNRQNIGHLCGPSRQSVSQYLLSNFLSRR